MIAVHSKQIYLLKPNIQKQQRFLTFGLLIYALGVFKENKLFAFVNSDNNNVGYMKYH